jgi:hypothetical protein
MALSNDERVKLLERHKHAKVRILAHTPCPAASALFDHAAARLNKHTWTVGEWKALMAVLDACELTVAEWLSAPFDAGPCLSCAA